ncbi:hypothetical protein HRR83_005839 [Exophiala dermatitidis]|uniref:histone acetyltransferase n=2 Tax=Exophiala dermatitidis TaxID=5970 RepID=H6BUM6_EXODN|nr:uncharacterized protein HMPREF1120_03061 [Exophiala dermatitidis NIH/UT8656]KAJ4508749.1 hypothetical protein HRR73_007416 [Exophiala dermatitidis]EHY54901.1 hypothetical protein HMPREF1120_03061 [Exophiala dermatitidis NIH/UT8656]KAJ4510991.1 hypothetical protein HRR75_005685 [Exophiala dermatitidis]KAJ4513396.1 hypothetical protein HRR74_006208 [Exophiala dermatitidis]KAJ4538051.1 hypothetical protein HRR77_007092 [Exophiala dermatitidis]
MSAKSALQSRLAAALPIGISLWAYHISTTPSSTSPLFAPVPGEKDEPTLCESHFLAVASPPSNDGKEVLVYAVEILIFSSPKSTTVFVSKADSSGFSSRLNAPKRSPSVIGTIISTFIEFLLEPRLIRSRVVLSLFARSQNQYLFPGSIENKEKHVLDDRQLIKWWCRVLDNVLRKHDEGKSVPCTATAHLLVPGCDKAETRAFFPPSSRQDPPSDPKWINSYPVELLVTDISKPPRHLVPRLPDDPKSRFLDDLDGDFVDDRGQWRSVKTLEQFWEMMSYRQECSAGRLVGFLWLVFSPGRTRHESLNALEKAGQTDRSMEGLNRSEIPTPEASQPLASEKPGLALEPLVDPKAIEKAKTTPPSSPAAGTKGYHAAAFSHENHNNHNGGTISPPSLPRLHQRTTTAEKADSLGTHGEAVLDSNQYQALMDQLLQSDFAGEAVAVESTKLWINKTLEFSGTAGLGYLVTGERTLTLAKGLEQNGPPQVNVLTGIRRKRKVDSISGDNPASSGGGLTSAGQTSNALPDNLVRKRAKE